MPTLKKNIANVNFEELTQNSKMGISSKIFELLIYVPHDWVENPEPDVVISSSFATQKQLKSLINYASVTSIDKINKNELVLSMEIAEPYIKLFYDECVKMPEQAKIRVRAQ